MLFGGKKSSDYDIKILINGEKINIVSETKFLGVTLDSKLSWKAHIQSITKKVAKSIGVLIRARQFLDKKTMKQLYYTFVYPHLIYCIAIWGKATAQNIWPLLKLQKMAIRIITNTKKWARSTPIFKAHNMLKLPELYDYNIGIFMFRYSKSLLPIQFNSLFTCNREIHSYNTRNAGQLRTKKTKTKIADRFITKTGIAIWNWISSRLVTNTSLNVFKKSLSKYLIDNMEI